jgi:hypothetical protein
MPPSDQAHWMHSDQLILPKQSLSKEEAEPFLSHVFGQLARKPRRLKLTETARVARYLKAIAAEMPGSLQRVVLDRLAEMIWLTVLEVGRIEIATKPEAIRFLQEHAHTYLSSFDVKEIVEQVDQHDEPSRHREVFRPPNLMGEGRSVQGGGPARLRDDLTERIYVAYYALRRAGIRNARSHIAAVLNQRGLRTQARSDKMQTWGSPEVIERVQQFEDGIVRRQRLARFDGVERIKEIARLRNMLVDSWIYGFRFAVGDLRPRSGTEPKSGA